MYYLVLKKSRILTELALNINCIHKKYAPSHSLLLKINSQINKMAVVVKLVQKTHKQHQQQRF